MAQGTVKWFKTDKGYGFIQPKVGGADVFFHISALRPLGMENLPEGQEVYFEIVPAPNQKAHPGKVQAVNLELLNVGA